ncbi:MAG: hypothetical protein JJE13_06595 [Thermoleophilia bacterium]|nr:hypothetical protein [Thermoleophilia bacterium]
MEEVASSEIEKVLLFISDARERAAKARKKLIAENADSHLIDSLERVETSLADSHRELMQGTYFAVPERNEQLAI